MDEDIKHYVTTYNKLRNLHTSRDESLAQKYDALTIIEDDMDSSIVKIDKQLNYIMASLFAKKRLNKDGEFVMKNKTRIVLDGDSCLLYKQYKHRGWTPFDASESSFTPQDEKVINAICPKLKTLMNDTWLMVDERKNKFFSASDIAGDSDGYKTIHTEHCHIDFYKENEDEELVDAVISRVRCRYKGDGSSVEYDVNVIGEDENTFYLANEEVYDLALKCYEFAKQHQERFLKRVGISTMYTDFLKLAMKKGFGKYLVGCEI